MTAQPTTKELIAMLYERLPELFDRLAPVQKRPQNCGTGYCSCVACVMEPPPECQTEAEKTAFAFGWWKALEANRAPQRPWVGLTDDDKVLIKHDANFNQFITAGEYADRVQQLTEARLKDKNNG